jgi:hypothetical protein
MRGEAATWSKGGGAFLLEDYLSAPMILPAPTVEGDQGPCELKFLEVPV